MKLNYVTQSNYAIYNPAYCVCVQAEVDWKDCGRSITRHKTLWTVFVAVEGIPAQWQEWTRWDQQITISRASSNHRISWRKTKYQNLHFALLGSLSAVLKPVRGQAC